VCVCVCALESERVKERGERKDGEGESWEEGETWEATRQVAWLW
jgi:hypothetical protein